MAGVSPDRPCVHTLMPDSAQRVDREKWKTINSDHPWGGNGSERAKEGLRILFGTRSKC